MKITSATSSSSDFASSSGARVCIHQTARAKDNWTLTGDKFDDCKVDNMRAAPTFAISRSAAPRDERVWNIDLMGPTQDAKDTSPQRPLQPRQRPPNG